MKAVRVVLWAAAGATAGAIGTFGVLNLVGLVWYAVVQPADEGLDTELFYISVVAAPLASLVGAFIGGLIDWRRSG